MNPGTDALSYLLNILIDLYVMVVALRFLMQAVRADYYNPLAQFIVRASNPPLIPLRRVVPGFAGQDIAALLLCFALLAVKLLLFKLLGLGVSAAGYALNASAISAVALFYFAAVDLLALFFNIFFFALIAQAVISWINPGAYNPISGLLHSITAPLLRPVQRYIKPVGGLDLSPLVAIIGLQVAKILVIQPLLSVF